MSSQSEFLESYAGQSTDGLIALATRFRVDSIVLAFEAALEDKSALATAERVVLAVEAIEREVNNGGFSQFFLNPSRVFTPHIVESFELIDCPLTAALCKEAIKLLGVDDPFNEDALEDAVCNADDELEEKLSALDEAYYAGTEEPIADKLFEFIKRNRNAIVLG